MVDTQIHESSSKEIQQERVQEMIIIETLWQPRKNRNHRIVTH